LFPWECFGRFTENNLAEVSPQCNFLSVFFYIALPAAANSAKFPLHLFQFWFLVFGFWSFAFD
jgi:hypothetical protein